MNEMSLKKVAKNDQSGQALVEYVLLLAIAVALILGLMNQFYRPFGDWMKDYMGAYLECLIDVGELPSLGYENESSECNSKLKSGTLANGRPSNRGPKAEGNEPAKKAGRDADDSSTSGSTAGSEGSRRNAAEARGFQVGGPRGADGPGSAAAANGSITEKLPESQFFRSRGKPYAVTNPVETARPSGVTGVITTERKKIQNREQKPFTAARTEDLGTDSKKVKKLIVKPGERKIASEESSPSWSFSEYLKFGIIIIIIIALVLFLGGQILQISKSMEK